MVAASKSRPSAGFYVILVAIFVGGAAALGYVATRAKSVQQPKKIDPALLAQTQAQGYLLGKPDAPVVISEFGDFECPQCALFAAVTEPDVRKRLVDSGLVAIRYYDFPLTEIHKNTMAASHAAACANAQGKFWEMHDRLFAGQNEWNGLTTSSPEKLMTAYAQELGLDQKAFQACYDSQQFALQIAANRAEGDRRRINGTPTFFLNDRMLVGNVTYDQLRKEVDAVIAEKQKAGATPKAQ